MSRVNILGHMQLNWKGLSIALFETFVTPLYHLSITTSCLPSIATAHSSTPDFPLAVTHLNLDVSSVCSLFDDTTLVGEHHTLHLINHRTFTHFFCPVLIFVFV